MIVSANNTWKNINDNAIVNMTAPNDKGICMSNGTLAIKNFIMHPLVALIFRLEYKASIPLGQRREQVYFNIGWTLHLPAFNAANELSDEMVDCKFILGPGQTPNGDLIWDPNADDTHFY